MKVAVIGAGYVGLVAGACLADLGNEVVCVDADRERVKALNSGKVPIYEPGLGEIVKRNSAKKRLSFTDNTANAIKNSELVFIAVGTPQDGSGAADLSHVKGAAEAIGKAMDSYRIIITKSTVPVGTGDMVAGIVRKRYKGDFDVVSNPEFLREGTAVNDFMKPDRIVVGGAGEKAKAVLQKLYAPLNAQILFTDLRNAELIKYASNSYLAARISFINEIARLCDAVGGDVKEVAEGMGMDRRIGKSFLNAGCGYGGSCFPKDVGALIETAKRRGVELKILKAAQEVNNGQKMLVVEKLSGALGANLKGKRIAVLGLSFKPDTDDMREASSVAVIGELLKRGATVCAFDPVAMPRARMVFPGIEYAESAYSAASSADALLLLTEWNEFLQMDLAKIKQAMRKPLIIDGRNALNRQEAKKLGFTYIGIGR